MLLEVKHFSSHDSSVKDVKVIQLFLTHEEIHMKGAIVIVGHQAVGSGWGDHCFWAFVSCGKFSNSTPPIIKDKKKKRKGLHHPFSL